MRRPQLDVVIPLFNEGKLVAELHRRLVSSCRQTQLDWRIIYVDDGCRDETFGILKQELNPDERVEIVHLSRNFGQPAAILAGMDLADGDAVIVMDGDMQDPPELIPDLVAAWQAGHDVVIAHRPRRKDSTLTRAFCLKLFHRVFAWLTDFPIPENCGTFCLMSQVAADAVRSLPEVHRYFPGLRAWAGFTPAFVTYERPARAGGEPKQSWSKLFQYALDAILGFSRKPARLMIFGGLALIATGLVGAMILAIGTVIAGWPVAWLLVCDGFAWLVGLQLTCTGFLAEITLRVQEQVKQRPKYLVAEHFHNQAVRISKAA